MTEEHVALLIDLGVKLIAAVAGMALIYGTAFAKKFLEAKLEAGQYDLLKDRAEMVVRAFEQMGENYGWTSEYKKQKALMALQYAADALNLPVDNKHLDALIEQFVQVVNTETKVFEEEVFVGDGAG